ncbi:hypothetical protein K7X08_023211 [Anisodus acutangulus]|uniref:Helicase ATP-binding domain-containing protein n=1 Tax=Anisodus acutangulus TaxID=402998 RepID=A0A9Q1LFY0_9SOLA|nr:hypothetical protein K7X08_023211 [Anisodus acutangulus]
MDVICQAKSGMGKTVVFVLSNLQQIEPVAGQICHEFERFSTYLSDMKVVFFYGGVNIKLHKELLKNECPHIVVGTPEIIFALARDKDLSLRNVKHFILDECDKMLESLELVGSGLKALPSAADSDVLHQVQQRFKELPEQIDTSTYSMSLLDV